MSKKVKIGNLTIGGGEKIAIQSMSTFKISETAKVVEECLRLKDAGLDVMRYSVTDEQDAKAFSLVKKRS